MQHSLQQPAPAMAMSKKRKKLGLQHFKCFCLRLGSEANTSNSLPMWQMLIFPCGCCASRTAAAGPVAIDAAIAATFHELCMHVHLRAATLLVAAC